VTKPARTNRRTRRDGPQLTAHPPPEDSHRRCRPSAEDKERRRRFNRSRVGTHHGGEGGDQDDAEVEGNGLSPSPRHRDGVHAQARGDRAENRHDRVEPDGDDHPCIRRGLPAGTAAMTIHRGPFGGWWRPMTPFSAGALCAARGHRPNGMRWEVYGPHNDDPAPQWTEVQGRRRLELVRVQPANRQPGHEVVRMTSCWVARVIAT
jgi:hypothetical protein